MLLVHFFNASVEGLKEASEERREEKKKGKEEREPGGRMIGGRDRIYNWNPNRDQD